MANAVEVRGVSKRFRIQHDKSLKERVINFGRRSHDEFYALSDIELDIAEGSTVGLLGHNGSGKSTLLKCIAGILAPTTGTITRVEKMAALLELGAGFQQDLTGRENVYLNGAILGMSQRDLAKRFDDIVAFSELDQFIDSQVKHYSSGMYVRLGFAIAVNVDPELLLIDEVLAVGDEAFQRKCLERVREFQREGRTIVFVTHAPDLVRQICDRAVVLDHGKIVLDGAPGEAVRSFREHLFSGDALAVETVTTGRNRHIGRVARGRETVPSKMELRRTLKVRITDVTFEHAGLAEGRSYLLPHEPLELRVAYDAEDRVEDVMFGIAIYDVKGNNLFGANTKILGLEVPPADGPGEIRFSFADVPLLDGTYLVTLAIQTRDEGVVYDWHEQKWQFEVMNPDRTAGIVAMPLTVRIVAPGEHTDAPRDPA
ncbi:MAG TPA: ABC transporter ATP-binding protein [Acidimicrobiia bacterium]